MDDTRALIALYVEGSKWDDAFLLLNAHPGARARARAGRAALRL